MKKVWSLLLCTALVFALCACGAKDEAQGTDGNVVNPVTECATLQEVNDALGCRLTHPGVMGVTDERFAMIDCGDYQIGEYEFKVNGMRYALRFSPIYDHDISGVYVGDGTAFADEYSGDIEYAEAESGKLARWFNVDGQYCLSVEDSDEMEQGQFESIALEMQDLTNPALVGEPLEQYYASLVGEYQDCYSQRAVATVTGNGGDGVEITVSWGSSAFETEEWTMTAKRGEDGLLYYTDCSHIVTTTAEDGTESVDIIYAYGEGFFGENEGVLYWNGAADENCQNCVFEKMQ